MVVSLLFPAATKGKGRSTGLVDTMRSGIMSQNRCLPLVKGALREQSRAVVAVERWRRQVESLALCLAATRAVTDSDRCGRDAAETGGGSQQPKPNCRRGVSETEFDRCQATERSIGSKERQDKRKTRSRVNGLACRKSCEGKRREHNLESTDVDAGPSHGHSSWQSTSSLPVR